MTDQLLARLVTAVGSQYHVDAEIGRGGMAVVYRATDTRLHRRVAIKVLPPELAFNPDVRERFLREAQTAAQLAHPNIVPIYTVDEREGIVYFVMALVEGQSLAERLAREPRLPVAEARAILADVADALAYAHAQGVVHRDVKPDNVMLDRATGRARVTDFGIARAAAGDSRLTLTGVAIGTPAYMSPEQALGERELDGRSDIYSLGVIAYQMLAGETPFKASNTPAMLVKHVSEAPRPLQSLRPDAPLPLVHAIARALAKKPEDRWPDANDFRDALSGARDAMHYAERGSAPYVDPSTAPPRPAPPTPGWEAPPAMGVRPLEPDQLMMPPMPAIPHWGSKADWRAWRRAQKAWERERRSRQRAMARALDRPAKAELEAAKPVEVRIANLRRRAIGSAATVLSLGAINAVTSPDVPWVLFPAFGLGLSVLAQAARLWGDGVPLARMFTRGRIEDLPQQIAPPGPRGDPALDLASQDVLAGPHGEAVRRAAADRRAGREILERLAKEERDMIPDVGPTMDALAERVGALALTLHRLDADIGAASLPALDQRIASLTAEGGDSPTPEQERRLALLQRQRASIAELGERRTTLASQLESATLALQNLRLDLLKLRSSGLGSVMSDMTSATQEARALSREIGNAVDAVREVKRL